MIFLLYFFVICCVYSLLYQSILLCKLSIHQHKKTQPTHINTPVSIVICAKNEQENLDKNLPFILSQKYAHFEVIIVDDGSDIPLIYEHPDVKIIPLTKAEKIGLGKKYALQKGVAAAQYTWVLLTDADCRPLSNQWIASMMACANAQTQIVLGISPYYKENTFLNALIEYETAQTALQYIGFALLQQPYMSVGRNVLYNTALLKSKNWTTKELSVTSGDDDLAIQTLATSTNTNVCLAMESYTISEAKKNWREWISQKTRHYKSGNMYRLTDRLILGSYLISKAGIYLSFLLLNIFCISKYNLYVFITYTILNTTIQFIVSKKIKILFRWHYAFLTDFLYTFFTLLLGTSSSFRKTTTWK